MADEASVRMTVDSSQAILESQKYLRAATETFNVLQSKSQAYSMSLQQRIKFLEREIELQKESIRTNREVQTQRIERGYEQGGISKVRRGELLGQVRKEEGEDIKELRELNRVFKGWTTDQRDSQRRSDRFLENITRTSGNILGANDASGLVRGGVGGMSKLGGGALAAGGILALLGTILSKEVAGAMTMEPVMRDYAILTGRSMAGTRGAVGRTGGMNLGELGMTPSQYFTNYSQLYRAGGGEVRDDLLGLMAGEKALGLGRQSTSQLLGLERYGTSNVSSILTFFERYLRDTSQSIAVLPEILGTFTQEATAMLKVTGRVDSSSIAASVAAISKAYGLTGEPLQTVTGAMRMGLQQSSDPVVQALQFSAMSKAMPGGSLWQMEMAMENPLGNQQYITNFLNQLRQMSGGGELYARSIYNVFGQHGVSRTLAGQMSQGDLTPEMFLQEMGQFGAQTDYRQRAAGVTGELEKVTASWQGMWERSGFVNIEPRVTEIKALLEGIGEKFDKMNEAIDDFSVKMMVEAGDSNTKLGQIAKAWLGMEAFMLGRRF